MKKILLLFFILPFINNFSSAQTHKILESTSEYIKIEFNFEKEYQLKEKIINGEKFYNIEGKEIYLRNPGEPWLPNYILNIGIPFNSHPAIKILNNIQEKIQNAFILPTPDSLNQPFELFPYDKEIYNSNSYFPQSSAITQNFVMRYAHIANLMVSPYLFNPVSRELLFNKRIIIQVDFKVDPTNYTVVNKVDDKMTDDIIKSSIVNYDIAKEFTGKPVYYSDTQVMADTYWYNPQKDYFKIYLNKEGVYRITYDMLVNSGVPANGLQNNTLELFNNGVSIPLDVVDVNNDGTFNSGDYFQFVGEPIKPADQFTRMNIYNLSNVYWFSYQADTLNYYKSKNGYKITSSPLITNTIKSVRWEKDQIYQHFGHAPNDQRDYWYWGYAEARNRQPIRDFVYWLNWLEDSIAFNTVPEKRDVKIRVGLHGLTTASCQSGNGHDVTVKFNTRVLGTKQWNGQESAVFEKLFYRASYSSGDTVQFFADQQKFEINLYGNICENNKDDFVLINYIEFDYWRLNKTQNNFFYFRSPPNDFQENRYYLWRWMRDNMKIYVPERGDLLINPLITNDENKSVYFVDTIFAETDYYCVADDYFITPDSITHHLNPSDLRNPMNGADYIILTHPLFHNAANQLAEYRQSNLSGYLSPRVKVVNIFDIYNEFSYGLLNPFALNDFAKYVYENWQVPAPAFIVLMGDASHDYRSIFTTSRKNFVPSIPFHGFEFGQLPSDNSIVMVAGNVNDMHPDIAIGRLPCETLEEANILVDKIINYPADNTKPWKENVILLASGLNYDDQQRLRFNYYAKKLENFHLLPNGLYTTKVFNFPDTTNGDIEFWGDGPRMREEINKGATVVSYYGHGGGAQWDLIFTKDDIPELNNGAKLPFISSITCYTAHFDNAESFGEVFVKIPNKGAIGFWGSVSLTWWPQGADMNDTLFKKIFTHRNYVIGNAILSTLSSGNSSMIPQIAYLGDPAVELAIPKGPDFEVKSSDITIFPQNPLKDDTVLVTVNIKNIGITFPNDSVTVELFLNIPDTSNLVGEMKVPSFGQNTSINFRWIPAEAGLYNMRVHVNEKNIIEEVDHSDNIAIASFSVFDFGEPNIIKPVNGYFNETGKVDFLFSDIGFYFDRSFNYLVQIKDSPDFDSGAILVQSPVLNQVDGIIKWQTPVLAPGEYFWRAIIYDAIDTNYSPIKIFTTTNKNGFGYLSQKKQLRMFELSNINYSEMLNSLVLNTELKPPHPEPKYFIDSILISIPEDSTEPSTFTTDGTYFYFANLPFYANGSNSKIYKVGTGQNGTLAGENYGAIPDLSVYIYSSLLFHSGYLYTCTGSLDNLLRINPSDGDTLRIILADSLLLTQEKLTQRGGSYLYSDGIYVYNLAVGTEMYPDKFVLRIFNPSNNWAKTGEDIIFNGTIINNVMSFFVVNGYAIIYENYVHHFLRRYNLSDGSYEEEWNYAFPARDYFTVSYDQNNNNVYFTNFRPGNTPYTPAFTKYQGTYIQANGSITSQEIGPASKWHNLQFDIDQTNSNGTFKAYLQGKSKNSGNWEDLDTLVQQNISLADINSEQYNYLKLNFDLVDSSFGAGEPIKFKSLQVDYDFLPEISMIPKDMTFAPDSMLQGIDVNMNLKVYNYGYIPVDSLKLDFYMNDGDSVYLTKYISVQPDSYAVMVQTIETDTVIFNTKIKTIATSPRQEYFSYNNLIEDSFFVARDSTKPLFNITFDGEEILEGDIVSSQPEVIITLKDNSPLPIKEEHFTIVFDNEPLEFIPDTLVFEQVSPYPNQEAKITWTPNIKIDGSHTLEVLAKDASGNFFDSTSYRISFTVYNNSDLREVYNYPNPFGDNTYFTFELRGTDVPDELRIKIYTIAGRMIKELDIPPSRLQLGFNRIYWDGRDHDGDEIANGLYFYKVIFKNDDVVKTKIEKLAKVK